MQGRLSIVDIFETIYVLSFIAASILRSYYGSQFKRTDIVASKKESPIVFVGMGSWGFAFLLPFVSMFSSAIALVDVLAMLRLGFSKLAFYTASLQEWAADPDNPIVVS